MATEWNDRPGEAQTALSTDQVERVEALQAARSVLNVGAERIEFPHELTGVARFILDGTDLFNDDKAAAE